MPTDFRVCTYNIHAGRGVDGRRDLERIGDVIRRVNPDLVGLQEVDRHRKRSNHVDQSEFLAEYLDMTAVFEAAIEWPATAGGGEPPAYGVALLSAFPVEETIAHSLPSENDDEPRLLLVATIKLGVSDTAGALSFATTHLGLDASSRRRQAASIRAVFGESPERTVLVGDFNATPESDPLDTMTEPFEDALTGSGAHNEPTFPSPSVERFEEENQLSESTPRARLDYVLHSPGVGGVDGWIVDSLASDHSMVVADLRLLG